MATFQENLGRLRPVDGIESITLYRDGKQIGIIPNVKERRGSLTIYANLTEFKDGPINHALAQRGLELFAEKTDEARSRPGQHPNIDHLLGVTEDCRSSINAVINYKHP